MRTLALSLLILTAASTTLNAQTADDIINQHITAMGGKEKLQSIKNVYMEGVAVMSNGMEIDSKIWRVKDKLYRQEIALGSMGNVTVIVTPTKGWAANPRNGGDFKPIPDEMLKAMQSQMDIDPLVDYAAKGSKVELMGADTVAGKNVHKIKLTFNNGTYITYYLDDQTHYIVREARKGGGMMGGGGGSRRDPNAEINIDFGDYQKTADGYVFPNTIVAGGFGARTNVEKLEINKPVDEDKLSKPGN